MPDDAASSRANPFHRYRVAAPAHLSNADGTRYVGIAPAPGGFLVDHGILTPTADPVAPAMAPVGEPDRFGPDQIAAAVQRVCSLAAGWLDFDEREVEETRRLFFASPDGG